MIKTMITVHRYFWLPSIKNDWLKLEGEVTPFQRYSFVFRLWANYLVYSLINRSIPVFYVVKRDGISKLVAPLCIHLNKTYSMFGAVNGCEYCDFLMEVDKNSPVYLGALLENIKEKITFDMVKDSSHLFLFCSQRKSFRHIADSNYVNIPFGEGHANYFSKLSASVRQNIRTSYNRASKAGLRIELIVFYGDCQSYKVQLQQDKFTDFNSREYIYDKLSEKDKNDYFELMLNVYFQRHDNRYGVQTSWIKKFFLRKVSFATYNLKTLPYAANCMLFLDGNLAGFMGGYIDEHTNSFIVPRLSINDEYRFYSPGVILINETILFLSKNSGIRNLDLCKGEEPYKYKMGGVNRCVKQFSV